MEILKIIGLIILAFMLLGAIASLAACRLSSQISQQQEKLEFQARQKYGDAPGFDTVSTMIAKGNDKQRQWDRLNEICRQETINDIERLR